MPLHSSSGGRSIVAPGFLVHLACLATWPVLGLWPLDSARGASMLPDPVEVVTESTGYTGLEGPVWVANQTGGGLLYFSQQNSPFKIFTWDPVAKVQAEFRSYTGKVNGNAIDGQGRLITCESKARRLTRTEADGQVTVLVDKDPNGLALNEPNDVVVKSDGTIWFTTPSWTASELSRQYVLRHDPATGQTVIVVEGVDKPNGLGFSPDETIFYLNDNGGNRVRRYLVQTDNSLVADGFLVEDLDKWPDGLEVDPYGNVLVALFDGTGKGINIFSPDGDLLKQIAIPSTQVTNCAWGGADLRTLFVTARDKLYSIQFPALPEPPDAPTGLKVSATAGGNVQLIWSLPTGHRNGYWIERQLEEESSWARLGRVADPSAITFEDEAPLQGIKAFYRVVAYGPGGESDPSEAVWFVAGSDFFTETTESGAGLRTGWCGTVLVSSYPWVWTETHDWWYAISPAAGSLWLYDFAEELGWLWTSSNTYPYLYSVTAGAWLGYLLRESDGTRWFFKMSGNGSDGEWLVVPQQP